MRCAIIGFRCFIDITHVTDCNTKKHLYVMTGLLSLTAAPDKLILLVPPHKYYTESGRTVVLEHVAPATT